MRAVSVTAACVLLAFACSEPRVAEDRAAACSNHVDDDGDGLIDCDDPDCAGSEACEKTTATCENEIDDDRDGTLDCRQESCRVLAICKDAVVSSCLPLPTPTTVCPRGKGCYLSADGVHWCALEGPGREGDRCGSGDPSDRSQGCAATFLCNERRRCAHVCARDSDCTRNSICPTGSGVRLCSASCLPSRGGCDPSEECVAFQRSELTIAKGGWAHECRPAGRSRVGTVDIGGDCADFVRDRSDSEICRPGLLCIPSPDGAKCRRVCAAPTDGTPGADIVCATDERCLAVVPFSSQSNRFDENYAIGVCLQ